MLRWMLYATSVSALLSVAALLGERALRMKTAHSREVWFAMLLSSLLIPCLPEWLPELSAIVTGDIGQRLVRLHQATTLEVLSPVAFDLVPGSYGSTSGLDEKVKVLWAAASATILLVLLVISAGTARRRAGWCKRVIHEQCVYLSAHLGPAVVGLLRPVIVVPEWLLEAKPSLQRIVLAHEQSHIDARDPQLLFAALAVLLIMPWNVPLWWQLRRLRNAMEVDCDARVLQAGYDRTSYGKVLLEVGARRSRKIGIAATSHSHSFLERRIRIMLSTPRKSWSLVAVGCGGLSLAALVIAAQIAPPDPSAPQQHVLAHLAPAALEKYAGYYQYADNSIFTVKPDKDHLTVQFTGQPSPDEVYPLSESRFFYRHVDAQLSFLGDAGGSPAGVVLEQNGAKTTMPRVEPEVAARMQSAALAKVRNQEATPGSARAFGGLIAGIASGKPDFAQMNPQLAAAIRKDLPKLQLRLAELGNTKSIQFAGVDTNGFDIYRVTHENGESRWTIGVDSNGIITGLFLPR
jgi:bla regulator protein blaR1